MTSQLVILTGGARPWYQNGASGSTDAPNAPTGAKGERRVPTKNRAAAKAATQAANPIFLEAARVTTDPFWASLLNDLAFGKAPRDFRYTNGMLTYKRRSKTREQPIDQIDPRAAATAAITFIQSVGSIMSAADTEAKKQALTEQLAQMSEVKIESWSQVTTASHRQMLIERYVTNVRLTYQLTVDQVNQLRTMINMGVVAGYFNTSTIQIANGVIINITGLRRTAGGLFEVDRTIPIKIKRTKARRTTTSIEDTSTLTSIDVSTGDPDEPSAQTTQVSFIQHWSRFLTGFGKRAARHGAALRSEEAPTPKTAQNVGSDSDALVLPHSL